MCFYTINDCGSCEENISCKLEICKKVPPGFICASANGDMNQNRLLNAFSITNASENLEDNPIMIVDMTKLVSTVQIKNTCKFCSVNLTKEAI